MSKPLKRLGFRCVMHLASISTWERRWPDGSILQLVIKSGKIIAGQVLPPMKKD